MNTQRNLPWLTGVAVMAASAVAFANEGTGAKNERRPTAVATAPEQQGATGTTAQTLSKAAAAKLARLGGLPVRLTLVRSDSSLESDAYEAKCLTLLADALKKAGIQSQPLAEPAADGTDATPKAKAKGLQLEVVVTGERFLKTATVNGTVHEVTLRADSRLLSGEVELRRFSVMSRYRRDSAQKAGLYAMKHAAEQIAPKLLIALNAWGK